MKPGGCSRAQDAAHTFGVPSAPRPGPEAFYQPLGLPPGGAQQAQAVAAYATRGCPSRARRDGPFLGCGLAGRLGLSPSRSAAAGEASTERPRRWRNRCSRGTQTLLIPSPSRAVDFSPSTRRGPWMPSETWPPGCWKRPIALLGHQQVRWSRLWSSAGLKWVRPLFWVPWGSL